MKSNKVSKEMWLLYQDCLISPSFETYWDYLCHCIRNGYSQAVINSTLLRLAGSVTLDYERKMFEMVYDEYWKD